MSRALGTILIAAAALPAAGQLVENFDTMDCAYADTNTVLASGTWDVLQVFSEFAANSRGAVGSAARMNDDTAGAHLTTPPMNSVGVLSFYYRELNSGGGTFIVQKSVGGAPFDNVATQSFSGNTYTLFTADVNDPSPDVRLRIVNDSNPGHLIIDDLDVTTFSAGSNQPPVLASIGNKSVTEFSLLTFPVSAGDPADGDLVTLTVSNNPAGSVFNATDGAGTFTWTAPSPAGVYTQTFYASDIDGTVSEEITITVTPAGGAGSTNVWDFEDGFQGWIAYSRFSDEDWVRVTDLGAEGSSDSMEIYGRNADEASDDWLISPALSFSGISDASLSYWTRRNNRGPDITVNLSTNYAGAGDPLAPGVTWETLPYARPDDRREWAAATNDLSAHIGVTNIHIAFHYTSSGTGFGDAAQWNVDQVRFTSVGAAASNAPPVLNPVGNKSAAISNRIFFTVIASDPVDGDPVTLSVSNAPAGSSFAATNGVGSFEWDPAAPVGVYTSVFHAADKDGYDVEAVIFTIVDPAAPTNLPVIAPIGDKGISESNNLHFAVSASDADGDPITLTASNLPAGSSFASTNGSGFFDWPSASPPGVYTTAFYAVDNDGAASEEILITVYGGFATTGTIAFQGFEGAANDNWVFTGGGETTNDAAKTGQEGRRIGGSENISFVAVPVGGYDAVKLYVSVASQGGIENLDALDISVALNGEAFPDTPDITITEGNTTDSTFNVSWTYDAMGRAETDAGVPMTFAGDGTNGYAQVIINIPLSATSVSARIDAQNNNATEYYFIDDVTLASGAPAFSDAPVIHGVPAQTVNEQNSLMFDVSATDPGGDLIALWASNVPPGAVFIDNGDNSGTFLWAAAGPVGVYTTEFYAADDDGLYATGTVIAVLEPSFTTSTAVRIMSANLTSGTQQAYEDPGINIFQGLAPDIVGIQEFNYGGGLQALVDTAFGSGFYWYVEPGNEQIPNGIISRYPILSSGEWEDTFVSNRDFAWAVIDIPGTQDLHVVSVHFLTTGSTDRNNQANLLVSYIESNWDTNGLIVVCGDMNTDNRTENAINTLGSVVNDTKQPADQNGDKDTNGGRSSDYDYVLPNVAMGALETTTSVGGMNFADGIVFDSRLWASPPSPIVGSDSGAVNMQHMAVMKTFGLSIPASAPTSAVIHVLSGPNGTVAPGTVGVNFGGGQSFVIDPDAGFVVENVFIDGEAIGATNAFTFSGVTNNRSIAAVFAPEGVGDGDADGDGLPDAYEIAITGSATGLVAGVDLDGDDQSNLNEYRAGTQPTNGASFLGVVTIENDGGSVRVSWQGGATATQLLERLDALDSDTWSVVYTNLPPTPISNVFLDAIGPGALFYRVTVP